MVKKKVKIRISSTTNAIQHIYVLRVKGLMNEVIDI